MGKKKILYLTTRLPFPTIGGDKLRMFNILKQLKKQGHKITLVSLVTIDNDLEACYKNNEFFDELIPVKFDKKLAYLNAVKAVFNDKPFIVEYFYSKAMQKVVDRLIKENNFDIIIGYMIRIAPYLEKHKDKNIIIDFVDAISMMYERRIKNVQSIWDKFKIGIEYLKVRNYEKKCTKIFKIQTVISQTDKDYIEHFAKKANIKIIGNGVDTEYYKPIDFPKGNNICFVGSMQYIPNSEAAIYFATKVFPLIKKEIPDAKFKIIGANPRKDLFDAVKGIDGVEVTGRVDDVRDYMKDCKVSVCPVKIAGGIQNKILEAMSMGIPVVTTSEGAEGIGASDDILNIASSDEKYARKVIQIMQDESLQKEIGISSREFVNKIFSWEKVGNEFSEIIMQKINNHKILIIWQGNWPWDVRIDKQIKSLISNGNEVIILSRNTRHEKLFEVIDNVKVHRINNIFYNEYFDNVLSTPFFLNPIWIIKMYNIFKVEKPDLIIIRDIPLAISAIKIAKTLKIKTILDIAEHYPALIKEGKYMNNIFLRFLFKNLDCYKYIEKEAVRVCDALFVVIDEQKERILNENKIEANKISIVSNTPWLANLSFKSNTKISNKLKIVYTGNVDGKYRDLKTVIEACKYLSCADIEVNIVGCGVILDELKTMVNKYNLTNIIFYGWMEHSKMLEFLSTQDIGIVPHNDSDVIQYTIPNKIFDYMAHSLPIIVSSAKPLKRIVEETDCGYIYEACNPKSLAECINYILLNKSELYKKAQNGYNAIKNKYNWERDNELMLSKIREILEMKK